MSFSGKVFIVTGASSGIGKSTALMAVEQGAKVVFVARRENELNALCSPLNANHVQAISADVTKEEDRKKIIDSTLSRFGCLDVLVNAAGVIASGSIENTTL